MRIGGNVIWATDFREETKTSTQGGGGKGGGGRPDIPVDLDCRGKVQREPHTGKHKETVDDYIDRLGREARTRGVRLGEVR